MILPVLVSLKIEVIRFLVELNSMLFKSSKVYSYPLKLTFNILLLVSSRPRYVTPRNLAPFTRASSSGEEALYWIDGELFYIVKRLTVDGGLELFTRSNGDNSFMFDSLSYTMVGSDFSLGMSICTAWFKAKLSNTLLM